MKWAVEALSASHDRTTFSSGHPQLDAYLLQHARQHTRKNVGRTFVAVEPGKNEVLGYYTLSASSVDFAQLPDEIRRKLPRYPLPTALIGKLAVATPVGGQGPGEHLLIDALHRVAGVSSHVAITAVEVHAIDEGAERFYARYGFQPFNDSPLHLFLPLQTVKQLIESSIS